jgi:phosphoglycolate phosphatase-like HAD superfamily hydrolase
MTDRPTAVTTRPLDEFETVVWDLDGTLVRLVVDWDVVTGDVANVFEAAGIDADRYDLWGMLDSQTSPISATTSRPSSVTTNRRARSGPSASRTRTSSGGSTPRASVH